MANPFTVELSMREAPREAQARAATALEQPARAVGLRLTKRGSAELAYGPRVQFPFFLMLVHTLMGEKMTVAFAPGATGGTRVTLTGAVARGKQAAAADAEHWSEALGASAST